MIKYSLQQENEIIFLIIFTYIIISQITPDKGVCRKSRLNGVNIQDVDLDNVYFCRLMDCTRGNGEYVISDASDAKASWETDDKSRGETRPKKQESPRVITPMDISPAEQAETLYPSTDKTPAEYNSKPAPESINLMNKENDRQPALKHNYDNPHVDSATNNGLYDHSASDENTIDNDHSIDSILNRSTNHYSDGEKIGLSKVNIHVKKETSNMSRDSDLKRVSLVRQHEHLSNSSESQPGNMRESQRPEPAPRFTVSQNRDKKLEKSMSLRTDNSLLRHHNSLPLPADHHEINQDQIVDRLSSQCSRSALGNSHNADVQCGDISHHPGIRHDVNQRNKPSNTYRTSNRPLPRTPLPPGDPQAISDQREMYHDKMQEEEPEFREPNHYMNCKYIEK